MKNTNRRSARGFLESECVVLVIRCCRLSITVAVRLYILGGEDACFLRPLMGGDCAVFDCESL